MERRDEEAAVPQQHGLAVQLREHLDAGSDAAHSRCPDEHASQRLGVAVEFEVGLEARHLAAVGVPLHLEGDEAEVVAVEQDHPGAGPEHRPGEAPDRLLQPVEPDQPRDRSRLAARDDEPVEPVELLRLPDLHDVGAEAPQHGRVLAEVPLDGQHPDLHRDGLYGRECRYQPRVSSSWLGSSVAVEMPTIGSPRPADTRASTSASWKCVVASTIAFARTSGSPDLKMPEPTKTPSAPSCMQSAASAGVAMPHAVNVTTGRRPCSATQRTSSTGAPRFFASLNSSSPRSAPSRLMPPN